MAPATRAYLLDTHAFLWWITDDPRISQTAAEVISNPENKIYFSAVSAFEISVKARLGRLQEVGDPISSLPFHIKRNFFEVLPLSIEGALHTYALPDIHQDPFDRLLVGQCCELGIPLLTADALLKQYPISVIW